MMMMELATRLRAGGTAAWDALTDKHPSAQPPAWELPPLYERSIADAVSAARAAGESDRAEQLLIHYTATLPAALAKQLAGADDDHAGLFYTELSPRSAPRLAHAIGHLKSMLKAAGVDPATAMSGAALGVAAGQSTTVAALHGGSCFGGAMPLLLAQPGDVRALANEACVRPGAGWASAIDARVTAPIIHELCHLQRSRDALAPPLLDECLSGYLGVLAHRATAYPVAGDDTAMFGAPLFAQVGQALVRVFGFAPLLRAHAGLVSWEDVCGTGFVAAAANLGSALFVAEGHPLHLLAGGQRPELWLKLIALEEAGELTPEHADPAVLEATSWSAIGTPRSARTQTADYEQELVRAVTDGLAAMCLSAQLVAVDPSDPSAGQLHRVRAALSTTPIVIHPAAAVIHRDLEPSEHGYGQQRYGLPLVVARRLAAGGDGPWELRIRTPAELDRSAAALVMGRMP